MNALTPEQMRALAARLRTEQASRQELEAALRAAADQLEAVMPPFTAPQYAKLLQERDRLRAVIENAPHVECCAVNARHNSEPAPTPCTCWKADAL